MKHFLKHLMACTLWIMVLLPSQAQTTDYNQPVPLDPKVKFGTLPNGMKYYIRTNKLPEQRAEFYIVHNVGAILENDNQNGLAHFTEHMAFNGTTNFPKKALLDYLEAIGCKFGENVNAFTGMDVTCYNISSVPVTRDGIIDSCLLILHDWSNYISFDADEIESERGVIREEWRTRGGAQSRLRDKLNPVIYAGSKYATRNVIGDTAIINHFKHDDIYSFYHNWYRPDLQAVIIIGDFDVDQMEAKVKALMSTIPSVEDAKSKPFFDLPDNNEPLIGIATDAEATTTNVAVYIKHPSVPDKAKNLGYLRADILNTLINQMMNVRISDLLQKESAPCSRANTGYFNWVPAKDVFYASAVAKNNMALPSLELLLTESRRMQQYGFTQSELDRAKTNYLRAIQSQYAEREKLQNGDYIGDLFENFVSNEPACDIEYYQNFLKQEMPGISLAEINKLANGFVTPNNVVITVTAPEKTGVQVPTQAQLLEVFKKVQSLQVDGYQDKVVATTLIEQMPAKGSIIKEKKNKALDATEWTLSNGIKVVFKSTNFKEDQVMMQAVSPGGMSCVATDDILAARLMPDLANEMGLGNFSKSDLRKVMTGKRASAALALADDNDLLTGSASPIDMETMLQQVYLRFTQPRYDEEAYNAYMARVKTMIENKALNPSAAFYDSINVVTSGHSVRSKPVSLESLATVNLDKVKRIYSERFADPASFTFFFIGNIDSLTFKPLIETYLASLPSINKKEKYIDNGIRIPNGVVRIHFDKEMKTAKTSVFSQYSGAIKYTESEFVALNAIENILQLRYTESIREKEGGSYGVRVNVGYQDKPVKEAYIRLMFDTDPAKGDKMVTILHDEVIKLLNDGPSEQDLQKTKEFFLKEFADQQKENNFWLQVMTDNYIDHMDKTTHYTKMVNQLTAAEIKAFANKTFSQNQVIEIVMIPAKTDAK